MRREDDRDDAQRADEERDFPGKIDAESGVDQPQGKPPAKNASDAGHSINDEKWRADVREVHAMLLGEERRKPGHVKPPERVSEEFADDEGPGLRKRCERG